MLGLRGVRLGLVIPGLFAMQVRAIAEAAAAARAARRRPAAGDHGAARRRRAGAGDRPRRRPSRSSPTCRTGVAVADRHDDRGAAGGADRRRDRRRRRDFFSFGTNDLTQMGWGFSRDDVEGAFFSRYLELGIFGVSPFESIDRDGVGRLVRDRRRRGPARPGRTCTSASAASTAATRTRCTSSTRPAWTTCPARRSGCRSPGWRRAARRRRGRFRHPLTPPSGVIGAPAQRWRATRWNPARARSAPGRTRSRPRRGLSTCPGPWSRTSSAHGP